MRFTVLLSFYTCSTILELMILYLLGIFGLFKLLYKNSVHFLFCRNPQYNVSVKHFHRRCYTRLILVLYRSDFQIKFIYLFLPRTPDVSVHVRGIYRLHRPVFSGLCYLFVISTKYHEYFVNLLCQRVSITKTKYVFWRHGYLRLYINV